MFMKPQPVLLIKRVHTLALLRCTFPFGNVVRKSVIPPRPPTPPSYQERKEQSRMVLRQAINDRIAALRTDAVGRKALQKQCRETLIKVNALSTHNSHSIFLIKPKV